MDLQCVSVVQLIYDNLFFNTSIWTNWAKRCLEIKHFRHRRLVFFRVILYCSTLDPIWFIQTHSCGILQACYYFSSLIRKESYMGELFVEYWRREGVQGITINHSLTSLTHQTVFLVDKVQRTKTSLMWIFVSHFCP